MGFGILLVFVVGRRSFLCFFVFLDSFKVLSVKWFVFFVGLARSRSSIFWRCVFWGSRVFVE